ncbi:hypothetical protein HGG75_21895 [Ochrobactrum pseudogrignonense]|nr:hypothetical protein [Brucella pseudogrignonensis]
MIKTRIRKAARAMADWPVVGRFIRIGVAVIRLPEVRDSYSDRMDMNKQMLMHLHEKRAFRKGQIPQLLEVVADINQRQGTSDNDKNNLIKSVPVSLRAMQREINEIQQRLNHKEDNYSDQTEKSLIQTLEGDISSKQKDTDNKISGLSESVAFLLGRVEFVRRELMFEMRYGASSPNQSEIKAETKIINEEKLIEAQSTLLKLNLGCGHIPLDGYINVDRRALDGVDLVSEVDDLPFEEGSVEEIFSAHLMEHFPQEQLKRELLPHWFRILKNGGSFHAVVPDAQSMMSEYMNGSYPYDSLREVMFGGQDYDGDFHFNMFVPSQVEELLANAGFTDIRWLAVKRRNGSCYEMEFQAKKP